MIWMSALQRGPHACYVSPYGDVYPCVQFPLPSGNVRRTRVLGYLAPFRSIERSSLDHGSRPSKLLPVHACRELYALSGAGVHGREYARAFNSGLREVLCQDGNSIHQFVASKIFSSIPSTDTERAANCARTAGCARGRHLNESLSPVRGALPLHASAVAIEGYAVALVGGPGAGKFSRRHLLPDSDTLCYPTILQYRVRKAAGLWFSLGIHV